MKNLAKIVSQSSFTAIVLAAVIGFTVIACSNGTTGSPPPPSSGPTSVTYTSTDGSSVYELVIAKKGSRAAYDPQSGDDYVLTVAGAENYKSSGTVKSASGGSVTLTKDGADFTVTIADGEMTKITGTIKDDTGATKTTPDIASTDPALNGTWESIPDPDPAYNGDAMVHIYNNGVFEMYDGKGIYTTSGGKITHTFTHMYGWLSYDHPDKFDIAKLYTKSQIREKLTTAELDDDKLNGWFEPWTQDYSISGNTLTFSQEYWGVTYETIFTKK